MNAKEAHKASTAILGQLSDILRGHDPRLQGLALAEATALWVAGHDPELREDMIALHLQTVRNMVPHFVETLDAVREALEQELRRGEEP